MSQSSLSVATEVLSHNLRLLRDRQKKTQSEIARAASISFRLYQKLESGKGNPTVDTLGCIARIFNVSIARLFRLDEVILNQPLESFLDRYSQQFKKVKLFTAIRNFEGDILYSNPPIDKFWKLHHGAKLKNLNNIYDKTGRTILEAQIWSEVNGVSSPYTNYIPSKKNKFLAIRFFPVVIYENRSSKPSFTALYITDSANDSHDHYFLYCEHFLKVLA